MNPTPEQKAIDANFKQVAVDIAENRNRLAQVAKHFGIYADAYPTLQAALDAGAALGCPVLLLPLQTVNLPPTGISIDLTRTSLLGFASTLLFSQLSGVAILGTGPGQGLYAPYWQTWCGIEGVCIKNATGSTNESVGLKLHTDIEPGVSHVAFKSVNITGFDKAIQFGSNTYVTNFSNCDIWNVGTCIDVLDARNSGERISFVQCNFFNSTLAVKGENPDADLYFSQCSFDYNTKHIDSKNVLMEFHGCHIEGKNYTAPIITADGYGANLKFFGGRILNTENTTKPGAIVQCDNNATMRFYSPDLANLGTTGRVFATGNARRNVKIYNPVGYEVPGVPLHTSDADNQFLDGGFSQNSVADTWTVVGTGTRVSPTLLRSGDGNPEVSATLSTAKVQGSNAHSLKFTKRWGSSSAASLYVSVPIDRKKPLSAYFSLLPAAGVTGTIFISFQLAGGMYYDANGLPSFRKAIEIAQFAVDLANVSDWLTQDMLNRWYQPDGWADNLIISINAVLMSGGDLYIGGAQVSSF